ncbi:hypothetical protein HDV01_001813 [Terramyces sp. JEL0728]|nr:hypothetical protein HDV01_001813 [Terramyces sp. JEL0728]
MGNRFSDFERLSVDDPFLELKIDSESKSKERDGAAFYSYLKEITTSTSTDTLYLSDILLGHSDKVAAADAFYNVLHLATKGVLRVDQNESYGDILLNLR